MQEIFEKYYKIIQSNELFEGIDEKNLPAVLENLKAVIKQYVKGEYIRMRGEAADFIGIVLEGELHILQDDYYGCRSITASVGAGSLFAEAFVCAGVPQLMVDISANTDCSILFLNSENILNPHDVRNSFHDILIRNLLGIVARKNMYLNRKLKYAARKTTAQKLLAYLNDCAMAAGSNEFVIPFNRQALADYLGVERSAMSAEIGRLVKSGIIETNHSYFKLLQNTE